MKFVREAQKWTKATQKASKEEITQWQADWAVKYANSIPDLVVDDTA